MSRFLTPLVDCQIGSHLYRLVEPLQYQSDLVKAVITVPSNFVSDEESCPRWLPIVYSLFGDVCDQPAWVHDWLYYSAIYDRKTADKILLEAMETLENPIPKWQMNGIYYGLRIAGMFAWNAHRKAGHGVKPLSPPLTP